MTMKYLFFSILSLSFLSACSNTSNSNDEKSMDSARNTKQVDTVVEEKIKPAVVVSTVKIGDQEWMTNDIKTTVYNNGEPIFEAKKESNWVKFGEKKVGCYRILKNGTFVYNGYAVNDKRGIFPTGFILPSKDHFKKLINYLGAGETNIGKATKSMATYSIIIQDFVDDENGGDFVDVEVKTNGKSGFNAKRGGFIYSNGGLDNEGNCSYWWTSSRQGGNAYVVDIGYCSQDIGGGEGKFPFTYGFAVRGIKSN